MKIVRTVKGLREDRLAVHNQIGFVPTMGSLHDGHLSLIDLARQNSDYVVVSIFVNPTQFNNPEDLNHYPRNLEKDLKLLETKNVDLVFCPDEQEIYSNQTSPTRLEPSGLAEKMEGKFRPGHFSGVCTIVNILFNLIQPHVAVFGEKDFQQLRIIQEMVSDLKLPIKIIAAPIYREANGLAASSRNQRLSSEERQNAAIINQSLELAKHLVAEGETKSAEVIKQVKSQLANYKELTIEYLTINNAESLEEVEIVSNHHRIFFAGYLNQVRLIDNKLL